MGLGYRVTRRLFETAGKNHLLLDDIYGRVPGPAHPNTVYSIQYYNIQYTIYECECERAEQAHLIPGGADTRNNYQRAADTIYMALTPVPDFLSLFISQPLLNMQITINEIVETGHDGTLHNLSSCQICHRYFCLA